MKKISLSIFTVFLSLMLCIPLFSSLSYADTSGLQKEVTTLVQTPLYKDATKKVLYDKIPKNKELNVAAYHLVGDNWWCKVTYKGKTGWIELKNIKNSPFRDGIFNNNATYKVTHIKGSNVRKSYSTGAPIDTTIPKGTKVKFSTFKVVGNDLWGKISYSSSENGTCKNKWVCIKEYDEIYINFIGHFKTTNKNGTAVRKTPLKSYSILYKAQKGTTYYIYRIELNKENNWWCKVKGNDTWIYSGNLKPN